jgi:hypothetical protein
MLVGSWAEVMKIMVTLDCSKSSVRGFVSGFVSRSGFSVASSMVAFTECQTTLAQ